MNKILKTLLIISVLCSFALPVFAQEASDTTAEQEVQTQDLEIKEPRILPDHFLYRFKNTWRKIREVFTFNPVAKLELKEKFASTKLIEIRKLAAKKASAEIIKKATENYNQENKQIRDQVMALEQKAEENPKLNSFLNKFTEQQMLHYRVLERLEKQVPEQAIEKITEQREIHLEHFKDVMLKLENKEKIPERLESVLENMKEVEFKELKDVQMLQGLRRKMPEKIQKRIQIMETKALENFKRKQELLSPKSEKYLENETEQKEEHSEEAKANCPLWTPFPPEFCKNGRIVSGGYDENGCPLPPKCITPENPNKKEIPSPDCQLLWWRDNEHQSCGQKKFCGMFMYYGLKTFKTKQECEI